MQKIRLKDIIKNPDIIGIGNNVDVKGWVRTKRGNNFVQFIALNDGSIVTNLQIVVDNEKFDEEHVKEELADVMVYCQNLADKLGVDPDEIINKRISSNFETIAFPFSLFLL